MPFLGNIINFVAVLGLGILGALIKRALPERITSAITCALGVCVLYICVDGALEKTRVTEGFPLSAGLFKVLVMILSMVIGTFIGEILDLDKLMTRLGAALEKKLCRPSDAQSGNFAKGFVSCTLLFCIGAMAVNGSIEDALGSPDILIAKAVIDGISVFMMATTLGIGCAFSAFPMLIYQGAIAIIA